LRSCIDPGIINRRRSRSEETVIEIKFSTDNIHEAAFLVTAVQAAVLAAKSNAGGVASDGVPADAAPSDATPAPEVATAASAPDTLEPAGAAVLPPAVEAAPVAAVVTTPARRGRGRPPKNTTPAQPVKAADPSPLEPSQSPAVEPVTSETGEPVTSTGPVNLFTADAPTAVAADNTPGSAPAVKITSAAQGAAIGLTPAQRQMLFAQVYALKPDGPHKAIALVQLFGTSRVPDLKPDAYPEFDLLAARTLAGTYDPRTGRPE
jgi:hypothetical protein